MTRVVLAALASGMPMGQQTYETEILTALRRATESTDLHVAGWTVRSLRSPLAGDRRLALSVIQQSPDVVQRLAGRITYPRADLIHRLDLRLPPSPCEVVTVHDLAPLRFDDEGTLPRDVASTLRRARAVICPSRFAADEVAAEYGVSPVVIPNGLPEDVWSSQPLTEAQRRECGIPGRFVLHSGGATKRKNLDALIQAWPTIQAAHPDAQLVLTGPSHPRRDAAAALTGVRLLGRVERPLLLALMRSASVVVVPSLYEGFGFPALEAMASGTPVVTANRTSLPEVCGDAASLVEPTSEGIAVGIIETLEADAAGVAHVDRGIHRARAFTWKSAAAAHLAVYRAALAAG